MPAPASIRRLLLAVPLTGLAFGVAACGGARPVTSDRPQPTVPATTAAPAATGAAPTTPSASATPSTTLAPSGDGDLDQLDGDLTAFQQETASLDQAATATQETTK